MDRVLSGGGEKRNGSHRFMRIKGRETSHGMWLTAVLGVALVLWIGGWGNLSAQTDTEHEAEATLNSLQIDLAGEPNIPPPKAYRSPPRIFKQIVGGSEEWKLSYFCKQHTSDELRKIVHEQFATRLFDKKGKETKMVDYTVSSNPLGNQLMVRCPSEQDALAVL